jgi:hypothetical protein
MFRQKFTTTAEIARDAAMKTLGYYAFLFSPRCCYLRANITLKRIMKEIRFCARVAGNFPDGNYLNINYKETNQTNCTHHCRK